MRSVSSGVLGSCRPGSCHRATLSLSLSLSLGKVAASVADWRVSWSSHACSDVIGQSSDAVLGTMCPGTRVAVLPR